MKTLNPHINTRSIISIGLMRQFLTALKRSTSTACFFSSLSASLPSSLQLLLPLLIVFSECAQTKTKHSIINQQNAKREKERAGMMEGERRSAWWCSAPSTEQRWLNWVTETHFQRSSNAHQAHSLSLQPLRNDWGAAETRAGSQARFGGIWTSCTHP